MGRLAGSVTKHCLMKSFCCSSSRDSMHFWMVSAVTWPKFYRTHMVTRINLRNVAADYLATLLAVVCQLKCSHFESTHTSETNGGSNTFTIQETHVIFLIANLDWMRISPNANMSIAPVRDMPEVSGKRMSSSNFRNIIYS